MNKIFTIVVIILTILSCIGLYQYSIQQKQQQNDEATDIPNSQNDELTINNRKFFKEWKFSKHLPHNEKENEHGYLLKSSQNGDLEEIPKILTYGMNILLEVDNQSRQENVDEINVNTKVTAQCDVQTMYDDEFNVFDIAVSYSLVYTHDIPESESGIKFDLELDQKLEQSSSEDINGDNDYYEIYEEENYESFEETPYQNYFYKLLVHGDTGDLLSVQIEIDVEENQMITYATQQLINDIFPNLKKKSYTENAVESDNMGLYEVQYKQEEIDSEHISINKQFDQDDYFQSETPGIDTEIEFDRTIILEKQSGIVQEGQTEYTFVLGDINNTVKLRQTEDGIENEEDLEEENLEALGQISGDMKCEFWLIQRGENDEEIAQDMFRYRQEVSVFEDVRLNQDIKADIEYGNGQEEHFEEFDMDKEDPTLNEEDDDYVGSQKSPVYFDNIVDENVRRNLQVAIGNFKRKNLVLVYYDPVKHAQEQAAREAAERKREAEMLEAIRKAEEAKKQEEERLKREAELQRQEEIKRQEEARIAKISGIVQEFKQMDEQLSAIENILDKKIREKVQHDKIVENMQNLREKTENILEKANEELKIINSELSKVKNIKEDLQESKNMILGQITRQIMDVKKSIGVTQMVYESKFRAKEQQLIADMMQVTVEIQQQLQGSPGYSAVQNNINQINNFYQQLQMQQQIVIQYFGQQQEKIIQVKNQVDEIQQLKVDEIKEILTENVQKSLQEIQGSVNDQLGLIQIENQIINQIISVVLQVQGQNFQFLSEELRDKYSQQIFSMMDKVENIGQQVTKEFQVKNQEIVQIIEIVNQIKQVDLDLIQNQVKILAEEKIQLQKTEIQNKAKEEFENAKNQLKNAVEKQFAAEKAMIQAQQDKVREAQILIDEIQLLKDEIANFPETAKEELKKIKEEAIGTVKDIIDDKIQELVDLDQSRYPPNNNNPETFREVKTLGSVRILGKQIGIDMLYQGYVEESQIALKLRVGDKYVATAMQQKFSNCSGSRNDNMKTQDFIFFRATFPILGIIVIPVQAGGRIQYGYTSGVTSGPRYCSFQLVPQFKAGLYAEGAVSLAGIISAGIYAQGNFLDTKLTLEATTDHGRSYVGLSGEFQAYSVEMGATYTKISCSLKNIDKRVLQEGENDENLSQDWQQNERRNLGLRKIIKKIGKVVKKVVHKVKQVAKVVQKVAYKVSDAVEKAYKIAINLHKICQKSKGSIAICNFQGKSKKRQIFYKSINVGL